MTPYEFIDQIAPIVQKYQKQYGYGVPSAIIAQAVLESASGTSLKSRHNNFFGLKYRPNRCPTSNGTFVDGSQEQNADGSYRKITDQWFQFPSMDAGVQGYFDFIKISNYQNARQQTDPELYLNALKQAHYATSRDYVKNNMAVIQKYGLVKYDQKPTPAQQPGTISIINASSTHNLTYKPGRQIEWIILHYTAGTTSTPGSARNVANYFRNTPVQASADFIVDQSQIVQYNPDLSQYYTWSVGGSKYSGKSTSLSGKYFGICKNSNSVSIEMCSNKRNTKTLLATDPDWYLEPSVVQNAVRLTAYLCNKYHIDINHVITHSMVNGKMCPQPWTKNEESLQHYYQFQRAVASLLGTVPPNTEPDEKGYVATKPYLVTITVEGLRIRSGPGTEYPVKGYVNKNIKYTIVETQNGFGRLKSGAGWISLDPQYCRKG